MHERLWRPPGGPIISRSSKRGGRTGPALRETTDRKLKTMNLLRSYHNWRRYRTTMGELSRLSQRELADIGITRADIPYVARERVR